MIDIKSAGKMMKYIITAIFIISVAGCSNGSDPGRTNNINSFTVSKEEVKDLADWAGKKINECCSKFGSKNLQVKIIWDKDPKTQKYSTFYDKENKILFVMLEVQWYGSLTNNRYWIRGNY